MPARGGGGGEGSRGNGAEGGGQVGAVSRTECCGNRNVDKAEAISRAAAAAAENCCAREKAKKGRKISIGFCFFSFAFCFCSFWGLRGGERVSRVEGELLEFHCCVCFVAATGHKAEEREERGKGREDCACVLR